MFNKKTIFILLASLLILLALVHFLYGGFDGRLVIDHDDYYLQHFGDHHRNTPAELALHLVDGTTLYIGVNGLLMFLDLTVGMNAFIYRALPFIFYILLVLGAFAIGKELGDEKLGLISAFLVATIPLADNLSRKYFLQHDQACLLIWAYWLALQIARGRWSWGRLVGCGLIVGLAEWVHPLAFLQSIPIFIFLLLFPRLAGEQKPSDKTKAYATAFLVPLIAFLFALPLVLHVVGHSAESERIFALVFGQKQLAVFNEQWTFFRSLYDFYGFPYLIVLSVFVLPALYALFSKIELPLTFFVATMVFQLGLTMYFLDRGLAPIGFSMFYLLLPMSLLACLSRFIQRWNGPPILKISFTTIAVASILLIGLWEKTTALRDVQPDRSFPTLSAKDRRTLIITEDMAWRVAAVVDEMASKTRVALGGHHWQLGSDNQWVSNPTDDRHSFSVLTLMAGIHGRELVRPAGVLPAKETISVHYFRSAEPWQSDHFRQFAEYIKKGREDENTVDLRWALTYHPSAASSLFMSEEYVFALLRKIKPAPPAKGQPVEEPEMSPEQKLIEALTLDELRKRAFAASGAGEYDRAAVWFQHLLKVNPQDYEVRLQLARNEVLAGHVDTALQYWEYFLEECEDFRSQLAALREMAKLEGQDPITAAVFDRFLDRLEAQYAGKRQETYMLRSTKVFERKQVGDWPGALRAVARLRRVLKPEQIHGVNYEEALLRWEINQREKAIALLRRNLRELETSNQLFADSAHQLARWLAIQGDFEQSFGLLMSSIEGAYEPNSLALSAMEAARHAIQNGRQERAEELLNWTVEHTSGQARVLVKIELGKLAISESDRPAAKRYFREAHEETTDPVTRSWLEQTLADL